MTTRDQTIPVTTVSKLIGSNPRQIYESIQNGSFPHGFRFYTQAREPVYKVAKAPLMDLLGLDEDALDDPQRQTISAQEAAAKIGSKADIVKGAIRNGTFPHSFYYITAKGSKVYRIAKNPFEHLLGLRNEPNI